MSVYLTWSSVFVRILEWYVSLSEGNCFQFSWTGIISNETGEKRFFLNSRTWNSSANFQQQSPTIFGDQCRLVRRIFFRFHSCQTNQNIHAFIIRMKLGVQSRGSFECRAYYIHVTRDISSSSQFSCLEFNDQQLTLSNNRKVVAWKLTCDALLWLAFLLKSLAPSNTCHQEKVPVVSMLKPAAVWKFYTADPEWNF